MDFLIISRVLHWPDWLGYYLIPFPPLRVVGCTPYHCCSVGLSSHQVGVYESYGLLGYLSNMELGL